MENNKSKGFIILIVVLLILVVGFGGYIFYDKFILKTNNNTKSRENNVLSYSKIDESKNLIYIEKGRTYDLLDRNNNKLYEKAFSTNYPVININTSSVIEFNSKIESQYKILQSEYDTPNNENECTCIKTSTGVGYNCKSHQNILDWGINETKSYIFVNITNDLTTYCASGDTERYIFTISKKSGNVLHDDEIAKLFNVDEKIVKNQSLNFIKEMYKKDQLNLINDETEEKRILNSMYFTIYNDKLLIGYYHFLFGPFLLYENNNVKELTYEQSNNYLKSFTKNF